VVTGQPAGTNVNITVSAKNGSGESRGSAAIAAVVPQGKIKYRQCERPLETKAAFS